MIISDKIVIKFLNQIFLLRGTLLFKNLVHQSTSGDRGGVRKNKKCFFCPSFLKIENGNEVSVTSIHQHLSHFLTRPILSSFQDCGTGMFSFKCGDNSGVHLRPVMEAECSLLTKLRQLHMLNEKQDSLSTVFRLIYGLRA